jgi:hypothetical protein
MSTDIYLPGISPEQIAARERASSPCVRPEDTIGRLRRRLWIERSVFGLVLLGVTGAWLYPIVFPSVWAVYVDGRPVVAMRERGSMAAALERYAREETAGTPAAFVQRVHIGRCDPAKVEVTDAPVAARRLAEVVQLTAPRAVIYVEGEPVAGLKDQSQAIAMLAQLKGKLAPALPSLDASPTFKEKIEVRLEPVAQDLWAEPDEALGLLMGEGGEAGSHTVAAGDTGQAIAARHNMTLSRLDELNPGIDLHSLRIGQSIALEEPASPLVTVQTGGRVTEIRKMRYETEVRTKPSLYVGKRFLKRPGRDGRQRVTYRIRFENQREVGREEVGRVTLESAVSKIVIIGGKPRP